MQAEQAVSSKPRVFAPFIVPEVDEFTGESARFVLSLTFTQEVQDRAEELMTKNNEGEILPTEKQELEQLVRADLYLATLQSKARLFLKRAGHA
jgi:hypothetical protein